MCFQIDNLFIYFWGHSLSSNPYPTNLAQNQLAQLTTGYLKNKYEISYEEARNNVD